MNKNRYRIVFNARRGQRMAVAETAAAQGKDAGGATRCPRRPERLAVMAVLVLVPWLQPLAQAQIVADPSAPGQQRPTVLAAPNGVPLVNIQTPSAAGVSRNSYRQFDVQANGAILNNSRGNAATQLGGWVQGNPWLATGSARVILNEVNSSNPSQLRGHVEVAGQRAEVIIANPAGINVDGGGFINASGVTLTSGTPVMNGGSLDGYRVQGGTIAINGLGLDTSGADYSAILARAVQVNAAIWAKELTVVTGANQIDAAATPAAAPLAGTGAAPAFALDVAQLGGMYAGKITLIGTEAGVGVRNSGVIGATSGDVVLQSNGWLSSSGLITSSGDTRIDAQAGIQNSGTLYAQGNAGVSTRANIDNSGVIAALGNTALAATGANSVVASATGSVLGAGVQTDGSLGTSGNLSVNATKTIAAQGQNLTAGDQAHAAQAINLSGSQTSARNLDLSASAGDLRLTGAHIAVSQTLTANASQTLRTDAAAVSANQINATAHDLSNVHGEILQLGSGDLTLDLPGTLDNAQGLLAANGQVTVSASQIDNRHGTIGSAQNQTRVTTTAGGIDNRAGLIQAHGALAIDTHGQTLDNTQGGSIASADQLKLSASALDNRGGHIQALRNIEINLGGTLDNSASLVRSGQTLSVNAASIINTHTQGTDQGLQGQSVNLSAQQLDNSQGAMRADHTLTVTSGASLNNTQGLLSSGQTLVVQDANLFNKTLAIANTLGTLIAGQSTTVNAASLSGDGQVLSQQDLRVALTSNFTNTAAVIANRDASLTTTGDLVNRAKLQAGRSLNAAAHNIDNTASGEISAINTTLLANDTLTNRGLIDGQNTRIATQTLNNLGTGRIYGDHLAIAATALANAAEHGAAPVIAARNRLDIGAQTIDNRDQALIFSAGDLSIGGALDTNKQATGQAGTVNNASATIEALGNLSIAAARLNNTNEHFSTQVVAVGVPQSFTEYTLGGGDVYRGIDLATRHAASAIRLFDCEATCASVIATGDTSDAFTRYDFTRAITATQVTSSDPAQILAGGALRIDAGHLRNDNSHIIAGGALSGVLGMLDNTAVAGERTTTDAGSATNHWRHRRRGRDTTHTNTAAYTPAPVIQTIDLTPTVFLQNTTPAGSGTQIAALSTGSVGQTPGGANAASVTLNPGTVVTPIIQVAALHGNNTGGSASVIRTGGVNAAVPNNRLFSASPNPNVGYLIETDPRFASYRTWLGSDYLLNALSIDPAATQKRLGDGFYEQRLIREQVAQLTGRRFLDGHADDEAQYRALLDAGITHAQAHQLRPGIALSAAQMAALTSDIVWLVEKTITLPNGQTTQALVPQLYVRVQDGDLAPSGALIAGDNINLNLTGDLTNSGTIAGRTLVSLSAENVRNLGGRIGASDLAIHARTDLDNLGGTIEAASSLTAIAGRDLAVASTTRTQTNAQGSRTNIDRVAALYVSNPNGLLVASAGRDLNLIAAQIVNSGQDGQTLLAAGNNLNLGTVTEAASNRIVWDGNNYRKDSSRSDVGTVIQTQGDILLQAGNDLNAQAATVASTQGALQASAGRDITLSAGAANVQFDEAHQHKEKGFLSSKTITTRASLDQTTALGSTFSGDTVAVQAGRDIRVSGSNVVSTQGISLVAGRDLTIEAAQETRNETHYRQTKQSGVFSSGGVGVTLGSRMNSSDQQSDATLAAASTVGSLAGDVTLLAGEKYRQTGSDVIAVQGDIAIAAQQITIQEARETSRQQTESKFKQSGLTLAITSPVISALQTVQQMSQAAGNTGDSRMQALAAGSAALAAKSGYDAFQAGQGVTTPDGKAGQIATKVDGKGNVLESRDATAADQVGGINLAISLGGSKSNSQTTQTSDRAAASHLTAGRDIHLTATGAGKDSDITIQGSQVSAGRDIKLQADNDIKLLAAQNTADQKSSNKSSSASVGISIGTGGFGVAASGSQGRGNADGNDLTHTLTKVGAGETAQLISGQDTTLRGAVVSGKQVSAAIGGNLDIASLQDTSTYQSKQQSLGGSVTVGASVSGSISASKSNANSTYASVTEQSGIQAGDGGFQVNVQGNTDLKGAVIASSQSALDQERNSFQTGGTLTTSDIHNQASYDAKAAGVTLGAGTSLDGKLAPQGSGAGIGKDSGNAASTTQSGISGSAGNQDVRTGDAETGIKPIFDAEKVQKEINAQVVITQSFGQQASKAVDDYAQSQMQALRERAAATTDPAAKAALQARVDELRMETQVLNVLIGAVTGLGGTALAKETLAAEEMRQITIADSSLFKGITDGTTLTNLSGVSVGGKWDLEPKKTGGTRADLDGLCGTDNERCVVKRDENNEFIRDANGKTQLVLNADGMVQFAAKDENKNPISLATFIDSPAGKKMAGITGGIQGAKGTLFGVPYAAGSWQDKVIEAFGGTHDHFAKVAGGYDGQGNTRRGMSEAEAKAYGALSIVTIAPSAPFALATLLPPEVWKAISILLEVAK